MLIKDANKIIISLSKPEKMPGYAYGLPAWECKTGGKLAKVPGSVCFGCYAMKGNYTRFPAIKKSQYKRLAALQDPRWVEAMATVINSVNGSYQRRHVPGPGSGRQVWRLSELLELGHQKYSIWKTLKKKKKEQDSQGSSAQAFEPTN